MQPLQPYIIYHCDLVLPHTCSNFSRSEVIENINELFARDFQNVYIFNLFIIFSAYPAIAGTKIELNSIRG